MLTVLVWVSEYRMPRRFSSTERRLSRRYDSSSPEKESRHRRSPSVLDKRRPRRRSVSPLSPRSQRRMSRDSVYGKACNLLALSSVKQEDGAETSATMGRKVRRHEQSFRENDMAHRQRDGKKPFYLTLDSKGKPHGLGKPTWVAQIHKLAARLDPSCTHIRKQTFEAVQTLKDRLDEDFEYSGTLNEGHLRALMGKAVTKRRGELISLIKNHENQPYNIDHQIWRRLKKLTTSKQREEKSE